MKNISNLYHAAEYKNKIINLLIRNEDFIKLIDPKPSKYDELDIADVLLGGVWNINGIQYKEQGYIFDYNFVDETILNDRTFVFVETDIDTVRQNLFADFNLYISIFTPKNFVHLTENTSPSVTDIKNMGYFASTYANRIDVLCDIVDGILNGTDRLRGIGDVQPAPRGYCTPYSPSYKFYGKRLQYRISNYIDSGDDCGG